MSLAPDAHDAHLLWGLRWSTADPGQQTTLAITDYQVFLQASWGKRYCSLLGSNTSPPKQNHF